MSARIRPHIRSNVVGYVAIFLFAIGGTAYATHPGGQNTISSADIIDNTVRTDDIRDANLRTADIDSNAIISNKIADGQVRSADVLDDNLTGTDIDESSLLGVNADKVDGGDLCRTGGVVTLTGTGVDAVCEQGALRVDAVCIQLTGTAANATLRITTSADDSFYGERGDSPSQDGDFDVADGGVGLTSITDDSMADPGVASQPASFYAGTAAGAQLSGTAGTRATLNGDGSATCHFVVGAIG